MTGPWHIRVYEKQVPRCAVDFEGPVELGRQDRGENKPYCHYK